MCLSTHSLVRKIFSFQYTLLSHVALLSALFAVSLSQAVIAANRKYHVIYMFTVAGLILPIVASFFMYVRCCTRKFKSFILRTMGILFIEFTAYVAHEVFVVMKPIAFGFLLFNNWSLHATLLIACTVFELVLNALHVYKLQFALMRLTYGSRAQRDRMLEELWDAEIDTEPAAGETVVPNEQAASGIDADVQTVNGSGVNEQIANEQVAIVQVHAANEQFANRFSETSI